MDTRSRAAAETREPATAVEEEQVPAEHRVHHHARLDDRERVAGGPLLTLCGLRIRPRPGAARMPCCPMCAQRMGGPCRAA